MLVGNPKDRFSFHTAHLKPIYLFSFHTIFNTYFLFTLYFICSNKRQDTETEWEADERRKTRCIFLTGRKGVTESEAAQIIIEEAKALIQEELGGLGIQWSAKAPVPEIKSPVVTSPGILKGFLPFLGIPFSYPPQIVFVGRDTVFTVYVCPSVRLSIKFCFLNILKSP